MHGLRKVEVRIWHADMGLDGEGERAMLEPLRGVAVERGAVVVVEVPWEGEGEGEGKGEGAGGLVLVRRTAKALGNGVAT